MTSLEARTLTPGEVEAFGVPVCPINWGVIIEGEPAACFQAEPAGDGEPDGWLAVHCSVKRRALHPGLTRLYAMRFSDRLLHLGARGLLAEIPKENRAAIRVAKAAGFKAVSVSDGYVRLERNGEEENGNQVQSADHLHRLEAAGHARHPGVPPDGQRGERPDA